jgi:4'-phosphopantetheinyl transferase EntD
MIAGNPQLQIMLDALTAPGILVGHRLIAPGDESALLPQEFGAFARSVVKVRRASAAARIIARALLSQLGHPPQPARRSDYASVGIDVEPVQPLDRDLIVIVATAAERRAIADDPVQARVLFVIKEAIYKAVHPLDGMFLDHHDVEVSFPDGIATIRRGRRVRFRYGVGARMVALAFISA